MLLLLFAITIIYGCFSKKNKYFWIWCALLLAILVNTSSTYADYNSYEYIFNLVNKGYFGQFFKDGGPFLWYSLCFLFGKIGLSYRGMVTIIIFVSMLLINFRIKELKFNNNLFWALFIIFPGLIQCVQLRFFLGTSIVFFGLIPLLENKKRSTILFLICILISYFIHSSCLIFIFFLAFPLFKKYGYQKTLVIAIFTTLILYFGFQKVIPKVALNFLSSNKFERYFGSNSYSSSTLRVFKILLIWIMCNFADIIFLIRLKKKQLIDNKIYNYCNNIQKAISLFFLIFDGNFHRFIEIAYMLLYINISLISTYVKFKKNNSFFLVLSLLFIVVSVAFLYTPYDTVISPLFTYEGFHSLFMH